MLKCNETYTTILAALTDTHILQLKHAHTHLFVGPFPHIKHPEADWQSGAAQVK